MPFAVTPRRPNEWSQWRKTGLALNEKYKRGLRLRTDADSLKVHLSYKPVSECTRCFGFICETNVIKVVGNV